MTSRSVLYSFVGHLVVLGVLFVVGAVSAGREGRTKVYNVSIVGVVGPGGSGGPGSGGKAQVGVAGMVGKPGKIGSEKPLPKAKPVKGTALVEEKTGKKPAVKNPNVDTSQSGGDEKIATRIYGGGGTFGGGGGDGSGGPGSGGAGGRPASAFEIALNNKIMPNWNEGLWKGLPDRLLCTVKFLLHADGRVSKVEVFEPSGNESFDLAARRAIEISKLPAPASYGIPGDVHEARVSFVNRPE